MKENQIADKLMGAIKESRKKSLKSPHLKSRVDIRCDCKRQRRNERDRVKFGTCRCDSYSLRYTLAHIIANSLYQYLADASTLIVREDWEVIEEHAKAIREWADADWWDTLSKEPGVKAAYKKKEMAWRRAMKWLTKEWNGLWW